MIYQVTITQNGKIISLRIKALNLAHLLQILKDTKFRKSSKTIVAA